MAQDAGVIRRRVVVTGIVQGVGYRAGVARQAVSAGITGFARNRADGSVVVELEGPRDAVAAVERWCRDGPRFAQVSSIDVEDVVPVGSTTFDVA
jgi:acylphosphatase